MAGVTISLHTRAKTLWSISSTNNDFVDGFMYGALFIIRGVDQYYFAVRAFNPPIMGMFRNLDTLKDFAQFIYHTFVPLHEAAVQTEDAPDEDNYVVWLRDPTEEGEANLIATPSAEFFQGLFTALNAAGIPYQHVVLHKPIRNGQNFDIGGLQLPTLQEFATRQQQTKRLVDLMIAKGGDDWNAGLRTLGENGMATQ